MTKFSKQSKSSKNKDSLEQEKNLAVKEGTEEGVLKALEELEQEDKNNKKTKHDR